MIQQVIMVVGVAQLKAKLSEYLARVRAGEEVLVTDHGRPVARIVPAQTDAEELAELERKGLIRVGTMRIPKGFFDAPRPADPDGSVRAALIEERREGR
jgi:prevent-host-death family protein